MGTIGRGSVVKIATVAIQNITSCEASGSFDLADDTTNSSGGYKENAYADHGLSLSVTAKYAETGGIQDVLDEIFTPTTAGLTYNYIPVSGGYDYSFTGRIADWNISSSTGETIEISFTVQSSGTITRT